MTNILNGNSKTPHLKRRRFTFRLGRVVMTSSIAEYIKCGVDVRHLLQRHERGDWGDLSISDQKENDEALKTGGRLLSAYQFIVNEKIYIITEANRSVTTIMLASEY